MNHCVLTLPARLAATYYVNRKSPVMTICIVKWWPFSNQTNIHCYSSILQHGCYCLSELKWSKEVELKVQKRRLNVNGNRIQVMYSRAGIPENRWTGKLQKIFTALLVLQIEIFFTYCFEASCII